MISLNEGALFYANDNRLAKLSSGILYADDFPISDKEEPEISWKLFPITNEESTFTIDAIDLELLNNMTHIPVSDTFTLQYNKPIMIQARWHKRHRINKKWLKRYGMKLDTVEVSYNAKARAYDICNGNFDIDASNMKYNFKPHQKRRNLKIEL